MSDTKFEIHGVMILEPIEERTNLPPQIMDEWNCGPNVEIPERKRDQRIGDLHVRLDLIARAVAHLVIDNKDIQGPDFSSARFDDMLKRYMGEFGNLSSDEGESTKDN